MEKFSREEGMKATKNPTPEIEKKYVHGFYDAIAPHFNSIQFVEWPKLTAFLQSLPSGSLVLDIGCGVGNFLGRSPTCYFIGSDISPPLIEICSQKSHEVLIADGVNLPYRSGFSDASISITVLHHLSTEARRKRAVEELVRVVRKGGFVLITAWAMEHFEKSRVRKWTPVKDLDVTATELGFQSQVSSSMSAKDSDDGVEKRQQEYIIPWCLPYEKAEIYGVPESAIESGVARIRKDDKREVIVLDRYCHVFSEGELERLVSGMDNVVVVERWYEKSNWCIILEKTC